MGELPTNSCHACQEHWQTLSSASQELLATVAGATALGYCFQMNLPVARAIAKGPIPDDTGMANRIRDRNCPVLGNTFFEYLNSG